MSSSFAVKLFLRGVKAPIYLAKPDFAEAERIVRMRSQPMLSGVTTTGQPFSVDVKEVVTIMGPELEGEVSQDDHMASTISAYLSRGLIDVAVLLAGEEIVSHWLAEMSFTAETLVILQDDSPAVISGYVDEGMLFKLDSAYNQNQSLPDQTIRGIHRVVSASLEDDMDAISRRISEENEGRAVKAGEIIRLLCSRPGELN